jgi:hypothetical protein
MYNYEYWGHLWGEARSIFLEYFLIKYMFFIVSHITKLNVPAHSGNQLSSHNLQYRIILICVASLFLSLKKRLINVEHIVQINCIPTG